MSQFETVPSRLNASHIFCATNYIARYSIITLLYSTLLYSTLFRNVIIFVQNVYIFVLDVNILEKISKVDHDDPIINDNFFASVDGLKVSLLDCL